MVSDSYRFFACLRCSRLVRICASCDFGNRYCPELPCAEEARREAKRRYRADYQRTRKGRRAHARGQQRYRLRLSEQKVTDHPSLPVSLSASVVPVETFEEDPGDVEFPAHTDGHVHCDFCGRLCGPFVHRWLGRW